MKNSNTYSALLNEEGTYSTFEIPLGIEPTRKLKQIVASIDFQLRLSDIDSNGGGLPASFASIDAAKAVMEFNKNRKDVTGMKLSIRKDGVWYNEDGTRQSRNSYPLSIVAIKKRLGIGDADIAEMFGYVNTNSYATSSAKKRYEAGLEKFYELVIQNEHSQPYNRLRPTLYFPKTQ